MYNKDIERNKIKTKEIRKMNEVMRAAQELMAMATPQEMEIYGKVFTSTEEQVQEQLGHSKDEMIATFILTWVNRANATA